MNKQEKRELIKRAFRGIFAEHDYVEDTYVPDICTERGETIEDHTAIITKDLLDALAEQAIAVPVIVEHITDECGGEVLSYTDIGYWDRETDDLLHATFDGHHGIPGPAIALILPIKEER